MKIQPFAIVVTIALASAAFAGDGRIEISQADNPLVITNSGSYVLTQNLTPVGNAPPISISAPNVSIDLNGFALTGLPGSGDGIRVTASFNNIVVRNGIIAGWNGDGINGGSAFGGVFRDLVVYGNQGHGIEAGNYCRVQDCTANANTLDGIRLGVGGKVENCLVSNSGKNGITVDEGSSVSDCVTFDNANSILEAEISVTYSCRVVDNLCDPNGANGPNTLIRRGVGIYASEDHNVIMNNHVTGCERGIELLTANARRNIMAGNTAADNTTDWFLSASGNAVGERISDYTTTNNVNLANGTMNVRQ